MFQSSNAFGAIHDSLSFFRNAYDQFASYRAAIIRLDGLAEQNARAGDLHLGAAPANPTTARSEWTASRCVARTGRLWSAPSICTWSPVSRW